ncbi:MAG: single-stranded-DNA-specific exonuclease RecJ [Firmicutes bacterium]|nr:single-stranded-DNA-specific exonuclease RecJ [Bacillota bacterium]
MEPKRWVAPADDARAKELASLLDISPIIARILLNRGIDCVEKAQSFLNLTLNQTHSPFLLKDMDKAVERIKLAIERKERIAVYGDYDVDGQTATALLVRVFRGLCPNQISFYIPHRMEEGYGLNSEAIMELSQSNDLLITVDCGIVSYDEVAYANSLGLDVIISDHHEPGDVLPDAIAVLNPKRNDCTYPFKDLAGVGVAYKLVEALASIYEIDCSKHLDLVALGTVADIVPLLDENRIYTKYGLERLNQTDKVGLKALIKVAGLNSKIDAVDLAFRLGPRLNAVGRMGDPTKGVDLLLSEDEEKAEELAQLLEEENRARQSMESRIFTEAKKKVIENGWEKDAAIVVDGEGWHPGVIGIVASRLVEAFYRPTVVIGIEEGVGKASARSIEGFNIFQGIKSCSDLLDRFGGHEMAAGLTIQSDRIDEFRQRLVRIADETLTAEDYIPLKKIDAVMALSDVTESFIEELELLEPYGMGNPKPVLQVNTSIVDFTLVGKDNKHLKCKLQDHTGKIVDAIGFNMGEQVDYLKKHQESVEFLVDPQINEWNNRRCVQLVLRDMRSRDNKTTFIEKWMIQNYPWDFPPEYSLVQKLYLESKTSETLDSVGELKINRQVVDARGQFDKVSYILEHSSAKEKAVIYVSTPLKALELCRELRIRFLGVADHIGFYHELLSDEEQSELKELLVTNQITWLVSTDPSFISYIRWETDSVYISDLPYSKSFFFTFEEILKKDGKIHALYGSRDLAELAAYVRNTFLDRNDLAKLYLALVRSKQDSYTKEELVTLSSSLNLAPGVAYAIGVFDELGLVSMNENTIKLMPKPDNKLDLTWSVLYNEGMEKRNQIIMFLRNCLERGFFTNESQRKDKGYSRLS